MKLHLGVVDTPYSGAPRGKRAKLKSGNQTTGDVAEILEDNYKVMERFVELHGDEIAKSLEESVAGGLDSILTGQAPLTIDVFGDAMGEIETMFRTMLDTKELERQGYPGIPTHQAALRGVDHRKKHPYAKRPPRPSFVDTSLYSSSFKAWMEE
jgi:hypothetical protein